MRAAIIAFGSVLLPALAACGGGTTFPEPPVCATAAPATSASPRQAINQYLNAVRAGADRLSSLREALRSSYPGDRFPGESQFRVDFAAYADATICGAQNAMNARPPAATLEQFDIALDAALQDLIEHTQRGRRAVKARNVTDYRAWYQGVDEKIAAVKRAAAQSAPR